MADKTEGVQGKKKSGLLLVVGAVAALALAGGGGVAAFNYLKKSPASAGDQAAVKGKEKNGKDAIHSALNLEPFIVNLADKDEVRYVKASFKLGLEGAKEAEELEKNVVFLAAARDAIISLLTSKTSVEILTPEGKDALRRDILKRVNTIMPKGKVQEVYIVDFVIQL